MTDTWTNRWFGEWKSEYDTSLPDPRSFVEKNWSVDEREKVSSYLSRGVAVAVTIMRVPCQMCSAEFDAIYLSDGIWVWPAWLPHYVACHSVKPPDEFLKHMRDKNFAFPASVGIDTCLPNLQYPWTEGEDGAPEEW